MLDDGLIPSLAAFSRDAALAALARYAEPRIGIPGALVATALRNREALGSTGFGAGVAIPHARLAGLDRCAAVIARLPQAIDWQAPDAEPVDIVVMLLSPAGAGTDHLKALARISRWLRDPVALSALRLATDAEAMRAVVNGPDTLAS